MAWVKGTNNSETINLFDGVTFGDDVIWGYGGDQLDLRPRRRRLPPRRGRRRCAPRWTRLRYGELRQLRRWYHGEPELRSGGRRRSGRRHLLQHRESLWQSVRGRARRQRWQQQTGRIGRRRLPRRPGRYRHAVADEAMASVRAAGANDFVFVPTLIALLRHRRLKGHARRVLVGYGEPVVDALARFLPRRGRRGWSRHVPARLALIAGRGRTGRTLAGPSSWRMRATGSFAAEDRARPSNGCFGETAR